MTLTMYNDFNCDSISYCAKILNIHTRIKRKKYTCTYIRINIYIYVYIYASIEKSMHSLVCVCIYTHTYEEIISIQGII